MKTISNSFRKWSVCDAKVAYDDIGDAYAMADKWEQKVYVCKMCGKYHLATKKEKK
jgi:hypothetical protein